MKINLITTALWTLGGIICSLIIILTRISNTLTIIILPLILIASQINIKSVNNKSLYKKARI